MKGLQEDRYDFKKHNILHRDLVCLRAFHLKNLFKIMKFKPVYAHESPFEKEEVLWYAESVRPALDWARKNRYELRSVQLFEPNYNTPPITFLQKILDSFGLALVRRKQKRINSQRFWHYALDIERWQYMMWLSEHLYDQKI